MKGLNFYGDNKKIIINHNTMKYLKNQNLKKKTVLKKKKNVLSICNMPKSEMKKVSEYLYGTAY